MEYSARDIDVLDGVEVVRQRPFLFLEEPTVAAFLTTALRNLFADVVPPSAVRITVWKERALPIAFDSAPLPIARDADGVSELYRLFLSVSMHGRPSRTFGGGILNALSERLVVSTIHDDIRYCCAFARGGLVAFLTRARTDERFGTNWFTLRPDPIVLRGDLAFDDVAAIAAHCPSAAPIEVIDRRSERALWW